VIAALVRETGADVGVSHDGDADRVLLCDEMGSVLDGDEIMAIAALSMIESGSLKDNTLVATVMSNAGLDAAVQEVGPNDDFGLRVAEHVREHDIVYKVK